MIAKIVICNNLVVKNDYLFVLIQIFGKKLHLCPPKLRKECILLEMSVC